MAKIANVYANSLFELAKEQEKIDVCKQAYDDFIGIYRTENLKSFFSNPIIVDHDKNELIDKICEGQERIFKNFLKVLVKKGRETYISECYTEFSNIVSEYKNEVTVEIKAAKKLSDSQINQIITSVEKSMGKKVVVKETIDPNLLMGFDVLVDGELLDLSLDATFERLRKKLKKIEVKLWWNLKRLPRSSNRWLKGMMMIYLLRKLEP